MNMFRNTRHKMPALNTTSTADISFMLLIFFLVTTSMDIDKGLPRQLPPKQDQKQTEQSAETAERNLLRLAIKADGTITANGQPIQPGKLGKRAADFIGNPKALPTLPETSVKDILGLGRVTVSDRHVITIDIAPDAPYDSYFKVQNQLAQAYATVRDRLAMSRFRRHYTLLTEQQRDAIRQCYPQRVTETCPVKEGGRQ